jgi:hypothetical protein
MEYSKRYTQVPRIAVIITSRRILIRRGKSRLETNSLVYDTELIDRYRLLFLPSSGPA